MSSFRYHAAFKRFEAQENGKTEYIQFLLYSSQNERKQAYQTSISPSSVSPYITIPTLF